MAAPAVGNRWDNSSLAKGPSPVFCAALGLPMIALGVNPDLPAAAIPFGLGRLFLTFLKIESVLFGRLCLLAFLGSDFVDHLHWLNQKQLLDAVAVVKVTPGPVFTTVTFIGYLLGGVSLQWLRSRSFYQPAS